MALHLHLYEDAFEESKHPREETGKFSAKGDEPQLITVSSSTNKDIYAHLHNTNNGIEVQLFHREGNGPAKLLGKTLIDAPFHVALDRVHAALADMNVEQKQAAVQFKDALR